jgi:hypothetical protein
VEYSLHVKRGKGVVDEPGEADDEADDDDDGATEHQVRA